MADPIIFNKDGLFSVAVWDNQEGITITLDKGIGKYRRRIYLSPTEALTVDDILRKTLVSLAQIKKGAEK